MRISDVTESTLRILLKATPKQLSDPGWCRRGQRLPIWIALDKCRECIGECGSRERGAAREHLVEHASERPDVGALVDRFASCLLRAHVRCGPENRTVTSTADRECRGLRQVWTGT